MLLLHIIVALDTYMQERTTEVLMEQMAMQERNRYQEKMNRETEQRLRLEEARMMEEEDRLRRNDKVNAQRRFKRILDKDAGICVTFL